MTKMTIKLLYGAPAFYCAIGVWAFSNEQIFENNNRPLNPRYVFPLCDHKFLGLVTKVTPGTFLLLPFFFYLILSLHTYFRTKSQMAEIVCCQ